jgi:hypothetical protein
MKNCRQWKQRSLKLQDFFEWKSIPTRNIQVEDRADRPMRTSHGAELICGARNMPFSVKSIQLSNWILWQFSNGWCGIFITRRKILENIGSEADFDLVDKAWSGTGKWAEKVAQFRHPKIQAIRLAGDPNAPVLPEKMTLDELRESIMADLERCAIRARSICRGYCKALLQIPMWICRRTAEVRLNNDRRPYFWNVPMSITSLSCTNRPRIKFRGFLFLLYCTALFLTGWWIGWVLLLLLVPAGGRLDIFERERRMRRGQQTIKLIGYRSDMDPDWVPA